MAKKISAVMVMLVMVYSTGVLSAQVVGVAGRQAGDVLKQIPADCVGFIVVNNVKQFTGNIDAFIQQISPPNQPFMQGSILEKIRQGGRLGEGFNANGGFAVVLLEPKKYGCDIAELMKGAGGGISMQSAKSKPLPLVLMIPTTDKTMASMLAAYQPVRKPGGHIEIPRAGKKPIYGMVAGSYAILSPNLRAVRAVAVGGRSVTTALSATDRMLIKRNDLAAWINLKKVRPILDLVIKNMEGKANQPPMEAMAPMPLAPMGNVKNMIARQLKMLSETVKQMDDVSMGLRIRKEGISIDGRGTYLPDSEIGKVLAAYRPVSRPLLNRLPRMKYVVAGGSRKEGLQPSRENRAKIINQLFSTEPFSKLSAEGKNKLRKAMLDWADQVEEVQFCMGGIADTGAGQVGLACVVRCKSSQKTKQILADGVSIANELIQVAVANEELKKLKIRYLKGLEVVAGKKVDVIDFTHPELATMDRGDRTKMQVILGDDKIRLMIVAVDGKTLVMTLGGWKNFLAEAMKTANGTGVLQNSPGVARALARLPKKHVSVFLLNIRNLFEVVADASKEVGVDFPPLPVLPVQEPFAGAVSIEKRDIVFTGNIPTETVKGLVNTVMGIMASFMMPPGPMPPGGPPPGPVPPCGPIPPGPPPGG